MNYFDEIAFKDQYDKFLRSDVNKVHTVHPTEHSLEDIDPSELNEVDRQFISSNNLSVDLPKSEHFCDIARESDVITLPNSDDLGKDTLIPF